ncbi:MAG: DNA replication/repair protein RecF [Rickettsiales bacterium]
MRDRYFVAKLALTEFRNHAFRAMRLSGAPVVIFGENGAGKTNILEAVSLLAPGRGLRGSPPADLRRTGAVGEWGVAATIRTDEGDEARVGTGGRGAATGRAIHIDGKETPKQADLLDCARILWYAPAMQHRLSGGASERRQWLDRLAATYVPDHERKVRGYDYYARERLRLLTSGRAPDEGWLGVLEKEMAARAVAVAEGRVACVKRLTAAMEEKNSAFPRADLCANGETEAALASERRSPEEAAHALRARFRDDREEDGRSGRTRSGAQRGDFTIRYAQKNAVFDLCSTGEQKALLLSVLLAHMRALAEGVGVTPVLLLDEAFSHLDAGRRMALCEELGEMGAQCWLTGADREAFFMLEGKADFFGLDLL